MCSSNGPPIGFNRHPQLSSAYSIAIVSWRQSQNGCQALIPSSLLHLFYHSPPALRLPQTPEGLLQSCWQIMRRWKLIPPHPSFPWPFACSRQQQQGTAESTAGPDTEAEFELHTAGSHVMITSLHLVYYWWLNDLLEVTKRWSSTNSLYLTSRHLLSYSAALYLNVCT